MHSMHISLLLMFVHKMSTGTCDIDDYMYVYTLHVYIHNIHVNSVNETRHSKATMSEDNSKRKNELPQAGFEPATFCVLGRCSIN